MKNIKLFEDFDYSDDIKKLIDQIVEDYIAPSDEVKFREAFADEVYEPEDSSEVTSAIISSLQSIGMGETDVDQEELADTVYRFIG